ncbi:kinase-like protein [Lentinus brumalis]|uniref:non-specific serine/threonine protein kinase n=1 Tax=Lentinus brumalis TaxID=2498619 RepID=A0A371D8N4_9APHY|nr:kinase-like protein [Polyporus brumalis]
MTASAASTMPNYTGCIVDGRYELVRILGSGTYGVVYHAVDTRPSPGPTGTNASRAVKMIRKAGRKPSELAAARREIALHRLVSDHPSIITVHDAYEDDDYFYIVMDLCRGGDLFEPICKRVYVDNDALLRKAFVSLIDAVEACHSSRVYHRDLKPENILVSEDRSEIYLADFGMATNRSMVEDFYCGTAAYMSPECIGHLSGYKAYLTAYSDVWALGVIFVNMISGRNPWERATLDDPCFIQFIENPDFLFDVLPISEGANEIIRRAFVLNPRERFTLPALRQAVLDLDTFFRSEDELSVISGYTKSVAPTLGCPQAHGGFDSAKVLSRGSSDAGSVLDAKSAVPVVPNLSMGASCQPTLPVPDFPGFGSGSSGSSSSSRASSPASSLIVTPEATAVAPACLEDLEDSGMFACRDSALGSQIGLSSTELNV